MPVQTVGLIGCGVMGRNLALNLERTGHSVVVHDADSKTLDDYLKSKAAGKRIDPATSLPGLVARLKRWISASGNCCRIWNAAIS
jgi:6-phosphogluconate dehydrogenase